MEHVSKLLSSVWNFFKTAIFCFFHRLNAKILMKKLVFWKDFKQNSLVWRYAVS